MENNSLEYQVVADKLTVIQRECGINYTLDAFQEFLKVLGDPQDKLPAVIHIAGTNGKGSTSSFLTQALVAYGYRVGTFISPHMWTHTERIQINGQPISQDDFVSLFERVCVPSEYQDYITTFEILTAMMFLYFSEQSLDFIVLEAGLGGRLDATNVVKHPLLTLITSISLDHQHILGDDISTIAKEKL